MDLTAIFRLNLKIMGCGIPLDSQLNGRATRFFSYKIINIVLFDAQNLTVTPPFAAYTINNN